MIIHGNMLKTRVFSSFPPTPFRAIIYARKGNFPLGQATTPQRFKYLALCPPLWVFMKPFQRVNPFPQRHNAKSAPLMCVYACARAHMRNTSYFRCAVVPFSYLFEKKEKYKEITHNESHNALKIWLKSVVLSVVGCPLNSLNPLKNNKKGGFYA